MNRKIGIVNILFSVIMLMVLLFDYITTKHTVFGMVDMFRSYYGMDILISHFLTAMIPLGFGILVLFENKLNIALFLFLSLVFLFFTVRTVFSFKIDKLYESSLISQLSFKYVIVLKVFPLIFIVSSLSILLYLIIACRESFKDLRRTV